MRYNVEVCGAQRVQCLHAHKRSLAASGTTAKLGFIF